MGQNKDKEEREKEKTSNAKAVTHHLLQADQYPASFWAMSPSERLLLSFVVQHDIVWNITLVHWGQLSQLCPLPASSLPPAYLLQGQSEKQRRTLCCASSAQQLQKHWCVINIGLINLKHITVWAAMVIINTILAILSVLHLLNTFSSDLYALMRSAWAFSFPGWTVPAFSAFTHRKDATLPYSS